jgi:hypothetical protein
VGWVVKRVDEDEMYADGNDDVQKTFPISVVFSVVSATNWNLDFSSQRQQATARNDDLH